MDPRYSLTGLLVGFLVGLTGMGGGSLMTPLLILVLHTKPTVAVGSDLAYSAVTKLVGGWQHHRHGSVDYGLVWRLALGSVPGSLLGVWFVHRMAGRMGDGVQHLTVRMLGFVLILVAISLFARSHRRVKEWSLRRLVETPRRKLVWALSSGLVLGFLVGVTSVGSGSLFGVLLLLVFGLGAREMVGTDVVHAAILTAAAAGAQRLAGNVDYGIVANLLVGSIPGVVAGSRLAARMPDQALRPILASVLLLSGLKML